MAIPVINETIASLAPGGILGTVLDFIPVMVALLVFIAAASPVMRTSG